MSGFFSSKKEATARAADFEGTVHRKNQLLIRVCVGAMIGGLLCGALGLTAVVRMMPLKTTEIHLYSVDNQTGRTEEVTRVTGGVLSENEAVARYFTDAYLKAREGYNYFRLQFDYDTVMAYSSDPVAGEYTDLFKSPQDPQKIYSNAEHTATVEVISKLISPSSAAGDPDKIAVVRYKKTITQVLTGAKREEYWVAKLTFRFVPENNLGKADRDKNPLGFVVTSYLTEKENRK